MLIYNEKILVLFLKKKLFFHLAFFLQCTGKNFFFSF